MCSSAKTAITLYQFHKQSFSAGGYQGSLLEALLPVQVDRQKLLTLNTALVIVLDRSGSMTGEKLEIAKKAAIGSMELLSSLDCIGVVSFDVSPVWEVPLTLCANKADIRKQIGSIGAGGGTNMYPAMAQARDILKGARAASKHMILLTDGQSGPGDFERITHECRRSGVTLSTIAVGPDADRRLLSRLAEIGGGRYYAVDVLKVIPRIFARETVLAGRAGVVEETFTPQLRPTVETAITSGIDPKAIPPLRGYVITTPRREASTGMVRVSRHGEDPILAWWQIGLGKTVAFTSGCWPRWGPDWVAWSGFSKLWTQAVRWVARSSSANDLEISIRLDGDRVHVVVRADESDAADCYVSALVGTVTDPANQSRPLALTQVGPGEFKGTFAADTRGDYVIQAAPRRRAAAAGQRQSAVAVVGMAYSPEYRELKPNESLLKELSQRTGGRMLDYSRPETVFHPTHIEPVSTRRAHWDLLLRFAVFAFLTDVAARRLAIDPRLISSRWRAFVAELAGRNRPAVSGEPLVTLKAARDRARAASAGPEAGSSIDEPSAEIAVGPLAPAPESHTAGPPISVSQGEAIENTAATADSSAPSQQPDSSTASHLARLLAVRRRRPPGEPPRSSPS